MGDRPNDTRSPMTGPELLLGFVVLIIFMVIASCVFDSYGVKSPPYKVGPLPWTVE